MFGHLHIYDLRGRCIHSAPSRGDTERLRGDVPVAFLRALRESGFTATAWHADDNAGLATQHGHEYLFRVKPDAIRHDMRPGGAGAAIAAIRNDGVAVSLSDACDLFN